MQLLTRLLNWLLPFWRRLFGAPGAAETVAPSARYRRLVDYNRVHWVRSQSEAAGVLSNPRAIAIVEGNAGPKWLLMNCPDDCGEIRRISLSNATPPAWGFKFEENGAVSLHPSVHLKSGCRVHFILRNNRAYVI
jgi:hypothetical protein